MKKSLLLTLILVLILGFGAKSQTTPEGTYYNYQRTGFSYADDYMGGYEKYNQNGVVGVVIGENNQIWIEKIISGVYNGNWTPGTVSGNTLTVEPGFIIANITEYFLDPNTSQYNPYDGSLRLTMLRAENGTFVEDSSLPITFTINGDVMTLNNTVEDQVILGTVYSGFDESLGVNGLWNYAGDSNTVLTLFDEEPIELPEGVTPVQYLMESTNLNSGSVTTSFVNVAIDGSDFYWSNLVGHLSDSWVKGTISDNKITFPSNQFMGIFSGKIYDFVVSSYIMVENEWGMLEPQFTDIDELELTYDATAGAYVTTGDIAVRAVMRGTDSGVHLAQVSLAEFVEQPATPANPEIIDLGNYYSMEGDWDIFLNIPEVDVNGVPIIPEKLSYIIYVDGIPYTFDAERYGLEEDMTEIPMTFHNEYINVPSYYGCHNYVQEDGFWRIGVQSVYYGGGVEIRSQIVEREVYEGIGEEKIDNEMPTDGVMYNIHGIRVDENYRGIVIINGKKYFKR